MPNKKIFIVEGPNLNLMGKRDPAIYGKNTPKELKKLLQDSVKKNQIHLQFFQSNHEGALIDHLQAIFLSKDPFEGVIINPGGLSHTSVSLRDTMELFGEKIIEVHLSHLFKREAIRGHLITAPGAMGLISGFGIKSYLMALLFLLKIPPFSP